jgi:hypothetical protein
LVQRTVTPVSVADPEQQRNIVGLINASPCMKIETNSVVACCGAGEVIDTHPAPTLPEGDEGGVSFPPELQLMRESAKQNAHEALYHQRRGIVVLHVDCGEAA